MYLSGSFTAKTIVRCGGEILCSTILQTEQNKQLTWEWPEVAYIFSVAFYICRFFFEVGMRRIS